MKSRSQRNRRRSLRLPGYDYSLPGAYYVTLCTRNMECLFGRVVNQEMILNKIGHMVEEEWIKSFETRDDLKLDEWVLMPNHLHGIVVILPPASGAIDASTKAPGAIDESAKATHVGAIHELPLHQATKKRGLELSPRQKYLLELPPYIDLEKRRNMILPKFIGRFKMVTAKRINRMFRIPGRPLWQRNYWDHIIRDDRDLDRIRAYIRENPLRWQTDYLYCKDDLSEEYS